MYQKNKNKLCKGGVFMTKIDVYVSDELKQLINSRAEQLEMKVSEYFRILAISDISKQQLKVVKLQENLLLNDITEIQEKLENS